MYIKIFGLTIATPTEFNKRMKAYAKYTNEEKRRTNRYFVVMYKALDKDGELVTSFTGMHTEGCYINVKKYGSILIKQYPHLRKITITNVIELSKEDFDEFWDESTK